MKILFPTFPLKDIFSVTFFYEFPLELHITINSQYLISTCSVSYIITCIAPVSFPCHLLKAFFHF